MHLDWHRRWTRGSKALLMLDSQPRPSRHAVWICNKTTHTRSALLLSQFHQKNQLKCIILVLEPTRVKHSDSSKPLSAHQILPLRHQPPSPKHVRRPKHSSISAVPRERARVDVRKNMAGPRGRCAGFDVVLL